MWSRQTRQLIEAACEEDVGAGGDITAALLPGAKLDVTARVVPRQAGVICGLALGPTVCEVFSRRLGQPLDFTVATDVDRTWQDGDPVTPGTCVALVRGAQAAVLTVERTLLNFLGRMSGVATLTRRYVEAAQQANPNLRILDTRKTIPGWRELDKYAVRAGGGYNHRLGLYDAVLIKDNHLVGVPTAGLAAALTEMLHTGWSAASTVGDLTDPERGHSLQQCDETSPPAFIEIEVDNLTQLAEVCKVPGVDIVLLDNFSLDELRAAVAHRDAEGLRGKLALEASGGITLDTIAQIAATGIDRISVGALTHSATNLDISLDL